MEAEDMIPMRGSDDECEVGQGARGSSVDAAFGEGQLVSETDVTEHVHERADDNVALGGEGSCVNDTEVEEGQLVSRIDTVEDVHERADDIGAAGAEISDIAAFSGEGSCVNDTEVEEGQLIPDEKAALGLGFSMLEENISCSETLAETALKTVALLSENGCISERADKVCGSISGVKRARPTFEEQHPSVHVKYYGLSRESKQKLDQLLREWSEWHAQNSAQTQDLNGGSGTGEDIYFPALDIGRGNNSSVTFWMENEIKKPDDEAFIPAEDASVPLYDRGFDFGLVSADGSSNLEGGLELLDGPRCFNCGSYSHSLRECSKPRDNAAVNNSRKQLKSKRNQTAGMRNSSRYYQDSPGGKYEGLRPGVLDAETRRLLGLEESDPPPWLNRMRELGYPPGYLEPEDEHLPSGITIFADGEIDEEKEDGEILEAVSGDVPRLKGVKFPGINAPIPQNADERAWAARPSSPDRQRNVDGSRSNHSFESNSRGRHREQYNCHKDDDPFDLDRPSRYSSRYGDPDFSSTYRSLRENAPRPRSPSYGRSVGEKSRDDPLDSEDSSAYGLYSSFSFSASRRFSEHNDGLDVGRGDTPDYSSRSRDRDVRYRHRSGR